MDGEYNAIVVQLSDKTDLTWVDLQSALLTFESRSEQLISLNTAFTTQANLATHSKSANTNNWRNHRGGRQNRGRGRGRSNNSRPVCQVCGKIGHSAAHCCFRYDQNYMGAVPNNANQASGSVNSYGSHPAYTASANTVSDQNWYMDSGATSHITNDPANIENVTSSYGKQNIEVGNGEKIHGDKVGFSTLHCKNLKLKMTDVLHTPHITKNLLSVSRLTNDNNVVIEFNACGCYVKDKATGQILLEGHLRNGLYEFKRDAHCFTAASTEEGRNTDVRKCFASAKEKWHQKLGHPSNKVLDQVLKACNVKLSCNETMFCEPCQYGKLHNLPFNLSLSRAECPLALIHTDMWGPSPVQSTSGYRYYIQFLDDFSRHTWIYPLKHKGEAPNAFKQFKIMVENQFEKKIKILQSDWEGEFRNFTQFLQTEGVIFRYS